MPLTYTGANLAITARPITVTADAQSRIYGDANPALTYAVGALGLVNGDTLAGSLGTDATTASAAGTYAITQGTLVNALNRNYAITYAGANLVVKAVAAPSPTPNQQHRQHRPLSLQPRMHPRRSRPPSTSSPTSPPRR